MIELTLTSMTCEHCVRTVAETVQRVDPAAVVKIDLATQHVSIVSDRLAAVFAAALTEEGYAPA